MHTLLYVGLLIGSSDRKTIIETTIEHLKDLKDDGDLLPKITYALRYAKERGYLEKTNGHYAVTPKGEKRLSRLYFSQIKQQTAWDGQWRLVIFDIPTQYNLARSQIRRLIQQLGFEKLQQSIWVHPLPCLDEFKLLRETYGIKTHIRLITCRNKELDTELLPVFVKKYPHLRQGSPKVPQNV